MLAKVSVKVSTFILKCDYKRFHRREVRDEYPSFFFVPFGIGILYPCAACHDLYQEGWQQFSCIMVLMVFGIEIMEGFFFHLFFFYFFFMGYKSNDIGKREGR